MDGGNADEPARDGSEGFRLDRAHAEALVASYLDRHGATDLEGVVELFSEGASLEDPVGSPPRHGLEAIRAFYRETHARNGRLAFDRIGGVLLGGDELVFHVRARLARSANADGMDVIYVLRVDRAGRIAALRAWF